MSEHELPDIWKEVGGGDQGERVTTKLPQLVGELSPPSLDVTDEPSPARSSKRGCRPFQSRRRLLDHRGGEQKLVLTAKRASGAIRHWRKFVPSCRTPGLRPTL